LGEGVAVEHKKQVDEFWKSDVDSEKKGVDHIEESLVQPQKTQDVQSDESGNVPEVNFFNYVTSLAFQAMIFLGEIPSPITNKTEKNLDQAKFLIDTLDLIRSKTTGNLTNEEANLLNGTIYELQMRYVDQAKKEEGVE
jgi:hypothetical protein